jgi:O-antigen/teichoic acid export membrane protein
MIAKKSLIIVISHYISQLLGLAGLVVLAKFWGDAAPAALGTIAFAMSFISLFGIISDLGFSSAHIKRISEGKNLGKCIGTFAAIKIILTIVLVIGVIGTIFILKYVLNRGFYDATTESVVIIVLFHAIFNNLKVIPINTFSGTKEIAKLQLTQLTENIVKTPLTIFVALAGVSGIFIANTNSYISVDPVVEWPSFLQPLQRFISTHAIGSLAMTYVFGMLGVCIVGFWFLRKYPIKRPSLSLCKNYTTFAIPITIASIVATITVNVDKIMIGFFWTSTEVGYYFTVQRVLAFITILSTAVGTVLFPTISSFHAKKNLDKIKEKTRLAERYISMVMIPPIVVTIIFVNPIINIVLSDVYLPAAPVLIILVFWPFVRGITIPYSLLIQGMNKPIITASFSIISCLTNIILNFLFIPSNGLLSNINIGGYYISISGPSGAALATVLSVFVIFFGFRRWAKKLSGIKLIQTHTIRHIISGSIMGAILYYIAYMTPIFAHIHWYYLIILALMGLGIYLVFLFLLKEFKKEDLSFFLDIINPKNTIKYFSNELKNNHKKKS